jgi:hypothetical protein
MSSFGVGAIVLSLISCGLEARYRDQLRQFPEVLGGGCEQELVVSAGRSSQSQPIELEDAFEMDEQHLDSLW